MLNPIVASTDTGVLGVHGPGLCSQRLSGDCVDGVSYIKTYPLVIEIEVSSDIVCISYSLAFVISFCSSPWFNSPGFEQRVP